MGYTLKDRLKDWTLRLLRRIPAFADWETRRLASYFQYVSLRPEAPPAPPAPAIRTKQ